MMNIQQRDVSVMYAINGFTFLRTGHNIEVRRAIGNFFSFRILQIGLCSCLINCSSFLRHFSIILSALGAGIF